MAKHNRIVKAVLKSTGIASLLKRINASSGKKRFDEQFGSIDQHEVPVGDLTLAFATQDHYSKHWFFPRYYPNLQHEPSATELFIKHINQADVVFDIGAHLGYFSCVSAALAPKGEVHCFEMDELCIPLIDQNIEINGFKNVTVNNCGAGSESGTKEIPKFEKPNPGLSMKGKSKSHKSVQFVSIDDYADTNDLKPDFVKIDVEGAELQVLLGMQKVLQSSKIKLLLEIHPWHLSKLFSTQYSAVLELLEAAGFRIMHLIEHREKGSQLEQIDSTAEITTNDMLFCYKA